MWLIRKPETPNDRICPVIENDAEPYKSAYGNGSRSICTVDGSSLSDKHALARVITTDPLGAELAEMVLAASKIGFTSIDKPWREIVAKAREIQAKLKQEAS